MKRKQAEVRAGHTDLQRRRLVRGVCAAGSLNVFSLPAFAKTPAPHPHAPSATFVNRLRLPGEGGMFTPLRMKDVQQIAVVNQSLPLFPGLPNTPCWLYRTQVGGKAVFNPILLARPNDQIRLRLTNHINQPTIIHWHGLTNDQRNDGAGMNLIGKGQHYQYDFQIHNPASLNWYHPHPHQQAGEQTWRGLAGMLMVEDEFSDALTNSLGTVFGMTDIPLMLQDRTVEKNGRMPYSRNKKRWFHGMSGNEVLINLTRKPYLDLPRRWVRFRLLNASNARTYRLAWRLQGSTQSLPFHVLGTDGGLLPAPMSVTEAWLAAAQRLDIALDLTQIKADQRLYLVSLAFDPMHQEMGMNMQGEMGHAHATQQGEGAEEAIMQINVLAANSLRAGHLPATLRPPASAVNTTPQPSLPVRRFVLDHRDGQWRINGKTFHEAHHAFRVQRGTREVWEIHNEVASMPHPMHLHGFSFRVLSRLNSPMQWRSQGVDAQGRTPLDGGALDTVLVWPGETVRVLLDYVLPDTPAFRGEQAYMFHCHNLEHEDLGMMLGFSVSA